MPPRGSAGARRRAVTRATGRLARSDFRASIRLSSSTVPADRSREWALLIDPPAEAPDANPYAPLLGLTPPLRLALTAQAAGARAVVLGDELGRDEQRRLL